MRSSLERPRRCGFYRALLHLYPAAFRAEYGDELCAIFRARRRDVSGPVALLALWGETILDTARNAAATHADILRQDLRYGARTFGRSPGFTATTILIAALGIGANTAVFSLADHVLIRPLPFPDADRLVKLWEDDTYHGYTATDPSPANYRDWKRMSASFEAMGAYTERSVNLVGKGDPERLNAALVTADLFPLLGVRPALGRIFGPADDREGAPGTLLLGYGLWQTLFGGSPGVLGQRVVLDAEPYVIIGVMPRDFHFPSRDVDLWTPIRFAGENFEDRADRYLRVVARLRRGATLEQARAEMRIIAVRLQRSYPKENAGAGVTIRRLRDEVSRQARLLLMALVGSAVCVLLIACTNLANLLLARALVRRREVAVRTALGAGRERLVRQLFTESFLLAAAGGLVGVLTAVAAVPLLARLVPTSLPIAEVPSIDVRALVVAAVLTALTGVGFGVFPSLRVFRDADARGLREGARSGVGGRSGRVRSALVVAEVTAAVVLLVSGGLLLRALWRVSGTDPGFRADGVLTMRTALPWSTYGSTERRAAFYDRVLSGVRGLPGVTGAAYITGLPMVMRGGIWGVRVEGDLESEAQLRLASLRFVTPGFFAVMATPLRTGRDVSDADTLASSPVAVVSESFARRYFPSENPIGRRFKIASVDRTVAGVVGDIRVRGLETDSEPQVYLPYRQVPDGNLISYVPKDLVIRSSTDPRRLVPAVRAIVRRADAAQPVSDVRMLADVVAAETAPRLIQLRVLGAFAALALLLAATGIHALLAFAVSNRTQEIGVRMALGAGSHDILGMVLRDAVLPCGAGIAAGATLAYAASRLMQALLAGVPPGDAATFAVAITLSLLMTLTGSALPAIRALRVDPVSAIRSE